jgi:(p)ppGpp synthase/HD superfamily hydrolase
MFDILSHMIEEDGKKSLLRAKIISRSRHEGQEWGNKPYTAHLAAVENVLRRFGFEDYDLRAAAYLHDILEDTDTTVEDLKEHFSERILKMVEAVTDEPGKNRKERHQKTLVKIAGFADATILKMADRIANVEESWATHDRRLFMYQKEYRGFRKALRLEEPTEVRDLEILEMWHHLDYLLGWWEAPKKD